MGKGTLCYKDGSARFIGSFHRQENGTVDYIEGILFFETGKPWMEGTFQRGGLRRGKQYYPSGKLMFSGEYNDRERGRYYGPPYPVSGTLYDEAGKVLYQGHIPHKGNGSLAYPYIPLPDGKEMPVKGITGNHAVYRKRQAEQTADPGRLPAYQEHSDTAAEASRDRMEG